jgi:hypothetical protein
MLDRIVGQDAERRDDVLAKVLVLVVAPDHDEVRGEVVQPLSRLAEPFDQGRAMPAGRREPFVCTPLALHWLRPALRTAVVLGDERILEDMLQDARHVLIASGEKRDVCHAETENRAHGHPSPINPLEDQ